MVKIYLSPSSKEEIKEYDFGKVEAGTSKEVSLYLYNSTTAFLHELKIHIPNKDIKVVDFPSEMIPWENRLFKLIWKPSLSFKKGLRIKLSITGIEEYRP